MNEATETFALFVLLALPRRTYQVKVTVGKGCTAREALIKADTDGGLLIQRFGLDSNRVAMAVFGELVSDDYEMRSGDRLEVLRPLQQDPKEWRRQRALAERQQNQSSRRSQK